VCEKQCERYEGVRRRICLCSEFTWARSLFLYTFIGTKIARLCMDETGRSYVQGAV
jgi:hypothetical protein